MLKTTALVAALLVAYGAGTTSSTAYTPLQLSTPLGGAIKTIPDPANIWSWHGIVQMAPNETFKRIPVLVDFDGNGQMDTEYSGVRVLITDMQVERIGNNSAPPILTLVGAGDVRWSWASNETSPHLSTPLALQVGSALSLEAQHPSGTTALCRVNVIGRVVNL